ncbi:MAG: hypothetical protein KJO77_02415 [Bacteroidia bacterium]|nr:hypothetical protein [Bacteroidia bacterium]
MDPLLKKNETPQRVGTARTVTIEITVQSNRLYNRRGTVDDCVSIWDGMLGSGYGQPKADYVTEIFKDHDAIWTIKAAEPKGTDKEYPVELVEVSLGNAVLFGADKLYTNAELTIEGKTETDAGEYDYTIKFNILHNGDSQVYPIDPKLTANPK